MIYLSRVTRCALNCKYLIPELGCCERPEFKGHAKILKKDSKGLFLMSCDNSPEIPVKKKKRNKYNAKKVVIDGIEYDSKLEAERHQQLKLLERAGVISEVKYHVRFTLINKSKYGREIAYEADFVYKDQNGNKVVEDVKSTATKTRLYKLKKRLLAERYGYIIKEFEKKKEN